MKKSIIATTALPATATAGATVMVAAPANADVDRHGTCAGATYELNVDRERGGFEVNGDLDGARRARVAATIRHDGTVVTSRVLQADNEGELDLETWRRNTAGTDTFKLSVRPVGGSACSVRVTLR